MSAPVFDGPLPGDEPEQVVEEVSGNAYALALSAVDRASIDMQIATAKAYPRSITKSLREATELATLDEDTAASMFFSLPRGKNSDGTKKYIEGPSARLAEVMAYSWQNLRADADIIAEDKTTVTAMGTCFDLEKNVAIRVRVKRRITDSKGRRYNDDMIGVTSNAAISIALRNAVFKVVPRAFVDRIYHLARKASLGEAGTMTQKRQNAVAWFAKAGVTSEQLFALLGIAGIDDIGEDEYIRLRGLMTAIKEGETSIEETFRPSNRSEGTQTLNEALNTKKPAKAAPAAPITPIKPTASTVDDDLALDQQLAAEEDGQHAGAPDR